MRLLHTSSCYSWLGRSVHGSYTFVTASYSFLAMCFCKRGCFALHLSCNERTHFPCVLRATYVICISAQAAKRTVNLGQLVEGLPLRSLARALCAGKELQLWLTTHNLNPKPPYLSSLCVAGKEQRLHVGCKPPA